MTSPAPEGTGKSNLLPIVPYYRLLPAPHLYIPIEGGGKIRHCPSFLNLFFVKYKPPFVKCKAKQYEQSTAHP